MGNFVLLGRLDIENDFTSKQKAVMIFFIGSYERSC